MKCSVIILSFYCAVYITSATPYYFDYEREQYVNEDRWIWGNVDGNTSSPIVFEMTTNNTLNSTTNIIPSRTSILDVSGANLTNTSSSPNTTNLNTTSTILSGSVDSLSTSSTRLNTISGSSITSTVNPITTNIIPRVNNNSLNNHISTTMSTIANISTSTTSGTKLGASSESTTTSPYSTTPMTVGDITTSTNGVLTENRESNFPDVSSINLCNFNIPEMPSFKAPGRKISEEKCLELKWQLWSAEIAARNRRDCINYGESGARPTVGGRDALLGEFPHMGAIGWLATAGGYVFKCGSTLISDKFILTAAHCSKASKTDPDIADVVPKIVRLSGTNLVRREDNIYRYTADAGISRIIVHPEYKSPMKYYDIALMKLNRTVQFDHLVQPACLWTNSDIISKLGSDATLTGWGVLFSGSTETSLDLQAADVDIINSTYCHTLLQSSFNRYWKNIHEHQLCAGKLAGGVDACQGDSGGPLQVKVKVLGTYTKFVYQVIGVTSFGIGCALPNVPGLYTRVSSFTDWIEGYVWP